MQEYVQSNRAFLCMHMQLFYDVKACIPKKLTRKLFEEI